MDLANVAAQIMEHLCICEKHGYSQYGRYGNGEGYCNFQTDAGQVSVREGDRDCSSAACEAWELALDACCGNNYGITRYNSTWSMKDMFLNSGLFEWYGINDFSATRGDIYLDIDAHTAMCIHGEADNDLLGEFSLSENGTIDGEPGDQTGSESSIHWFYNANWDGILHYNGGADGGQSTNKQSSADAPRYRARTKEYGWHSWMEGLKDTGNSSDDFAGSEGCEIFGFEIEGYDYRIVRCDGSESINAQGNEDSAICGVEITGDVQYQVHWLGDEPEWGKWEHSNDDNGAGKDEQSPLDMIRVK